MRPNDIKAEIIARLNSGNRRSIHIVGSPGLGKTQIVAQAAAEAGVGFKVIHAPLMQPEDYGFPVISADRTDVRFIVSKDKFPIEGSDCPERGILNIDELPQADNSGQKILANLVQAREIHGQRIKPGWIIVSTGNRTTDRSGANRVLSHLKDRHTEIAYDASLDDWVQWALSNGVKIEVISFLRFKPNLLSAFDPQQEKYPTPRSWVEGVSASLGTISPAHELEIFKGDVGEGPAAEFIGFLKVYRKLPTIETILMDPAKHEIPKEPSVLFATTGMLAYHTSKDNFGLLLKYVERMPEEFGVLYMRDIITCKAKVDNKACGACERCELTRTADFLKWATSSKAAKLLK